MLLHRRTQFPLQIAVLRVAKAVDRRARCLDASTIKSATARGVRNKDIVRDVCGRSLKQLPHHPNRLKAEAGFACLIVAAARPGSHGDQQDIGALTRSVDQERIDDDDYRA
ncbi:hypothetical protein V8C44DRAFT_316353 [Trichoderma aethiopicum]